MSLRRAIAIAIGIGAILTANSAHADWQNTRWGMTISEVKELYPHAQEWVRFARPWNEVPPKPPPDIDKKAPDKLSDSYESDGVQYNVEFSFSKGRLFVVTLDPKDLAQCAKVRAALVQRYGAPLITTMTSSLWKVGADEVWLTDVQKPPFTETMCRITQQSPAELGR